MEILPYKIYRDGELVMQATERCRYPKEVERSLMEAGFTITLNGKRITKKEVSKSAR